MPVVWSEDQTMVIMVMVMLMPVIVVLMMTSAPHKPCTALCEPWRALPRPQAWRRCPAALGTPPEHRSALWTL